MQASNAIIQKRCTNMQTSSALAYDLPPLLQHLWPSRPSAFGHGNYRLHRRISVLSANQKAMAAGESRDRAELVAHRRSDLRGALWLKNSRLARIRAGVLATSE